MSEAKIDEKIIKKTQDTLGRIIQAPSLTEKLLNRPPVQFLQDITKSVRQKILIIVTDYLVILKNPFKLRLLKQLDS